MGPIGVLETSVKNDQFSLLDNPKFAVLSFLGSLISRLILTQYCNYYNAFLIVTCPNFDKYLVYIIYCGIDSLVGIATGYGVDGPVSNPGGDEIFRPSRPALGPTQPPVK